MLKVDTPGPEGRGWKRTHSELVTSQLPAGWKKRVADGADFILKETWVKANDAHYAAALVSLRAQDSVVREHAILFATQDAKVWPVSHCHGTGSLFSEIGAGCPNNYVRNRACCVQSWFRKTALWVL